MRARRALRRSRLTNPVAMLMGGALVESGWYKSFQSERPVDRNGEPVAWYTYPCSAFLETHLNPSMRVFEYGAGNSTLWYAERVAQVVAVEHDPEWAEILLSKLLTNCELVLTQRRDLSPRNQRLRPFRHRRHRRHASPAGGDHCSRRS